MTTFYANPYDPTAPGVIFETAEEYRERTAAITNESGHPVSEFEILFVDGEELDAALAKAWGLDPTNIFRFLEVIEEWSEQQKTKFIVIAREIGAEFDLFRDDPDNYAVDLFPSKSLGAFAEDCVEDEWFGSVDSRLAPYIDYDAIARDLELDGFRELEIAGERWIYRCG